MSQWPSVTRAPGRTTELIANSARSLSTSCRGHWPTSRGVPVTAKARDRRRDAFEAADTELRRLIREGFGLVCRCRGDCRRGDCWSWLLTYRRDVGDGLLVGPVVDGDPVARDQVNPSGGSSFNEVVEERVQRTSVTV